MQTRDKLISEITATPSDLATNTMKEMNLSEETIATVQAKIEENAKTNVQQIQGNYYETVD